MDLSIPIPKPSKRSYSQSRVALEDCLDTFSSEEYMEKCGYKCSKCKLEDTCSKQMTVYRLPKVLVIHLKRFQNSFVRREKLNTSIEIPLSLDMRPYAPHSGNVLLTCRGRISSKGDLLAFRDLPSFRLSLWRTLYCVRKRSYM